jgi:hypothetical protein
VQGFDAGADDYVPKPFHMEEVLARLRALLRRASGHATSELTCGPIHLDTRSGRVSVDGNPIRLTSHEYRLLAYLMHHMGHTQLSEESPDLNSENLLVLLVPLVFVYGVSLFFQMLDHMNLPFKGARFMVTGLFLVIMASPMLFSFLPPRPNPVAYPPYYPPAIQQTAGWMKENELMMSDIPWAVAWYGKRQCIWITLNAQEEFFAVNDFQKTVRGLYLTPQTMDARFLTQWVRAGEHSWGSFILESMVRREIPPSFPLRMAPKGYLPEQLFLTDKERWREDPSASSLTPTEPEAKKKSTPPQ